MKRKTFFSSKINWLAILIILQAVYPLVEKFDFKQITFKDVFLLVIGIAIIVIRTYFTSQPIKAKVKKERKPV